MDEDRGWLSLTRAARFPKEMGSNLAIMVIWLKQRPFDSCADLIRGPH